MKKAVRFNIFKLIGWSLVFYLFIFQPIINKNIYLGIEVILVLCLFFSRQSLFADNFRLLKLEYLFVGLICGYAFLLDITHFEIVYLDRFLASFFQGYFVSFLFIYFISKSSYLQENLSNTIITVCFIACCITLAAIMIPSVSQFCINHATMDAKDRLQELYMEGSNEQYRSYGLSESLNFTYAYVLSVIGCYLLSRKIKVYTPIMLIMIIAAIIFNARIAFVPLMVALVYLVLLRKKSVKGLVSFAVIIIVSFLLIKWVLSIFPELKNEWGLSFFTELYAFLTGNDSGAIDTMTGSMWVIPDNALDFIFGTGKSIYSAVKNSDVGYILQLNYGGITLLFMILFYFIYISRRILHKLSLGHWFTIIFIVSIFVLNFKGFYLAAIPGNRFLTFLYVYYIYASRRGIYELSPKQKLI